ncbi:hypothetical protein O6H91_02G144400 [Diphasiastrum complanatum]|uniref:Uncharacterized protein n=1 Tax=Diphasiastrum complanatum TaxID=34168 RepID=A0ACC2ELW8_DIPCM|nr:hypothetical protein O6H91_02G144400 [Diphasiastrum complanatum]
MDESFVVEYPAEKMQIVEKVIQRMRVPATFLNITILSGYHKDGHPSIWRRHDLKNLKSASAIRHQDCSH